MSLTRWLTGLVLRPRSSFARLLSSVSAYMLLQVQDLPGRLCKCRNAHAAISIQFPTDGVRRKHVGYHFKCGYAQRLALLQLSWSMCFSWRLVLQRCSERFFISQIPSLSSSLFQRSALPASTHSLPSSFMRGSERSS